MPYSIIDDDVSSVAPVRSPKTAYRGVSGLVSGHRYFSPEIGRWVSRDPIGEIGGINLHVALLNNPLGNTDALGHDVSEFKKWLLKGTVIIITAFNSMVGPGPGPGEPPRGSPDGPETPPPRIELPGNPIPPPTNRINRIVVPVNVELECSASQPILSQEQLRVTTETTALGVGIIAIGNFILRLAPPVRILELSSSFMIVPRESCCPVPADG